MAEQKPFNPFRPSEMITGGSRTPDIPFNAVVVAATIVPRVYKNRRDIPPKLAMKITYRPHPDQEVTEDVVDYLNLADTKQWAHSLDGETPIDLPDEDTLHSISQDELDAFSGPYLIPRVPGSRPALYNSTAFAEWAENLREAGWDESNVTGNSVECYVGIDGGLAKIVKKERGFKDKEKAGGEGSDAGAQGGDKKKMGDDKILVFETVEKQAAGGKKGGASAKGAAAGKGAASASGKPAGSAAAARPTAEIAEDLKEKVIAALAEAEDNTASLSALKSEILKTYGKTEATQALMAWNKAVREKLWEGDGVKVEGDSITLTVE